MAWERIGLVFTLLAFFSIYARTAEFSYVWDDVEAIRDNPIFNGPVAEGLVATQHDHLDPAFRKLSGMKPSHDSYRPLLYLSYRLDVALFGMSPRAMHLHNLLLAALSIIAFYVVASSWLASSSAILVATVIFALHPLQVEAVSYISARGDLLAGLFALLAVASALRVGDESRPERSGARRHAWLLVSTVCYVGSLLAKEAYVGLPLAFAGICLARGGLRAHRAILTTWLVALVAYLALRFTMGGVAGGGTGATALVALPGMCLRYLQMVLVPFDLSTERLYDPAYTLLGWLALGGVILGLYVARHRGWARTPRLVASGLWWMVVLLAPSVIVVSLLGVLADRYAYLPLAGFAVAVSTLLTAGLASTRSVRVLLGVTGIAWGAMCITATVLQVEVWRDNRALYSHAVAATPQSSMAHYRLGHTYAVTGEWDRAIPLFEHAVDLQPSNTRALNNLGVAYLNTGKYSEAADSFERALAESGQMHFRAWYNLGVATMNMGDGDAACAHVERALQINPDYEAAVEFRRASCGQGE
jgi:hypothetical protein